MRVLVTLGSEEEVGGGAPVDGGTHCPRGDPTPFWSLTLFNIRKSFSGLALSSGLEAAADWGLGDVSASVISSSTSSVLVVSVASSSVVSVVVLVVSMVDFTSTVRLLEEIRKLLGLFTG